MESGNLDVGTGMTCMMHLPPHSGRLWDGVPVDVDAPPRARVGTRS